MSLSNKKVLIVTNSLAARSETFVRNHIKYLSGTKFVFHGNWFPRIDDRPTYPLAYIDFPYRVWRRLRGEFLPSSSWKNTYILNEIRRIKPDVILVQFGTIAGRMVEILEQCRLPYVVYFRGSDASRTVLLKSFAGAYKRLAANAPAVVAVSRSIQDNLFKLGFPPEKVHYCPSGIETSKFETAARPDLAAPIFLATGRFVAKKAPYLTLLAFAKVRNEFSDAKLIMIGDGPLKKFCHELAFNVLKLGDSVQLLGSVDHSVVCKHLYSVRCFVQHSIQAPDGDSEGTPNSVMEAMMAGLPVIATRHAGIADIIEHQKTGFLVEEGDIAEMARWMGHLVKNPSEAAAIGKEARKTAMTEHGIAKRIQELEAIICSVMEQ